MPTLRQFFFTASLEEIVTFLREELGITDAVDYSIDVRYCQEGLSVTKPNPAIKIIPNVVLNWDASKEAGKAFEALEKRFNRKKKEVIEHYYGDAT